MNIDAVFGRYIAKDSAVHRMDPRAKLLLSILFMVMVFAAGSYVSLGVAALFTTDHKTSKPAILTSSSTSADLRAGKDFVLNLQPCVTVNNCFMQTDVAVHVRALPTAFMLRLRRIFLSI